MNGNRRRPAGGSLLAALTVVLAGCSTEKEEPKVDSNLFPTSYKGDVMKAAVQNLDDPTNIREAAISEPMLKPVNGTPRYTICVRFNPRDFNHDYKGLTERIGYFYAGRLNQLVPVTGTECAGAVYKPFPELEKYCLAEKCE